MPTCEVSTPDVTLIDKVQPIITGVAETDPSNCGQNDGSIVISATGAALEYSIDGGTNWQASGNFTGLGAGTYNVFVRNTDGSCTTPYGSNPVILTIPAAPSITNVSFTDPTECATNDGTITITATGGLGTYQYSIDSGTTYQNANQFTGLAGGTYCIFVRNADVTCVVTGQCVTLTDKVAPVIATTVSTDPTDCGVADGTITITASSSAGNAIQYSIDGGATWDGSGAFTGLSGGTYPIRVRNVDGTCIVSDANVVITDKVQPSITTVTPNDPSNCGVNDGSIVITATGASIEYSIDGGLNWQISNTFSNLGSGTYNISVRNTDGSCQVLYISNPVILVAPNAPSVTNVASSDPTDCGQADGTITISATGGTGNYEYSIDSGTTYQVSNVFNGLTGSGSPYYIFVRNNDGTCAVYGQQVTLTDKVAPVISNVASSSPTDCGEADGTITISASSSIGNSLEFSIDGGASWQISNVFSALSGGTYPIRVRNADGTCEASNPDVILIDKVQPIISSVTPTNPNNCGQNDGSIVIAAIGASLEYSIDGGTNWQTSGNFTGLGAGTYNIFVRNTDGSCTTIYGSNPVILTIPAAPSITNVSFTDPTECATTDGTITITAIGGQGSYEYSIDSGTTYQVSNQFTGLAGGTYCVFVRNADATCIVTGQCVTLTDKVAPTVSNVASTDPTDCGQADGTITIIATSSAGNALQYSIDGGATYQSSNVFSGLTGAIYPIRIRNTDGTCVVSNSATLTDKVQPVITNVTPVNPSNCGQNDGSIIISATGATLEYSIDGGTNWQVSGAFSNLGAGTYNVFVRNTDGSCNTPYISNPVILTIPAAPSITNVSFTDPTECGTANGTITITAIGGSGSYQYSIDSGTTYQASNVFSGLNGDTYCVFVRNADATCIVSGQCVTLTDKVAPIISTVANTSPTDCGVADGTITITASSSIGNSLEFSIDGGLSWQVSNVFSALSGGVYQIRVRNADGTCEVSNPNVTLIDKVQPIITVITPTNPTNCGSNDGSIVVTATGASLEYSMDGGTNWQASNSFTGLGAGTYNIFVRNTDGSCNTPYVSNPVILTVPSAPSITNVASIDPTDCGLTDGAITITAIGGQGSYEYSIDSGTTWQASNTFNGLAGGSYNIKIRNANGSCEVLGPIEVLTDKVAPVIASTVGSNPTDCGQADGEIIINATSPSGNTIQFSIDGGATWQQSSVFQGLTGGTYQIRVRNIDGSCLITDTDVILIDKVQPIITTVTPTDPTNCGANDGSIVIAATGASLEYSIDGGTNWQVSGNFSGLGAGVFNVFVRNTDGSCNTPYANNPVVLTLPNAPSITNVSSTNPTDCGVSNGTISIVATGGTAPLEYSIDGGTTWVANGGTFSNLDASTNPHQIMVRNAGGTCEVTGSIVNLTDPVAPTISSVTHSNPTDCGVADGMITITATSSAGNAIEYSVNGGLTYQSSNVFSGLDASGNTYEIRVRNVGGTCIVSDANITLIDKIQPIITGITPSNPSNCGVNDGSILVAATGASLEYSIDGGTNWQASGNFASLGAGTYNIFVRNTDGSCNTPYVSNPMILTAPNAPSITNVVTTDPTDCGVVDGTITVTATSGSGSYEYSIDSGTTWQTSNTFAGLDASGNSYCVFVRNADATCTVVGPCVTLTDKVAPVIASVVDTDPTECGVADGTITITATSPNGSPIQYSIDGGATWDGSGSFAGLDASGNTYEIRVRNANGTCIVSSADINLTDKVQPVINSVTTTDPSNCGQNDGSIVITATGASLEYSIDGGTNWQISGTFASLGAGTYNIFVRNTDGSCNTAHTSNPVILTAPNAPSITNVAFTDPTDCSVNDGTITITAINGSGSYQYSIDSGTTYQASNVFSGLNGGEYCIFVRNVDGTCVVTGQCVTLTDMVAPTISAVTSTNPTDCGVADGTITITATSTAGNALEYSVNGGATYQSSNVFSGLDASGNVYQIRVRNVGGTCIVSGTPVILTDKIQPLITGLSSNNPSNCGVADGSISIAASFGGAVEFSIDGGLNWQASNNFTGLSAGTYNVFIRNTDESCISPYASNPVILTAPNAPSITNVVTTDPTDCGQVDGTITVTAIDGSGAYHYSNDSGTTWQASNVFSNLAGGTYCIFVRNADGTCAVVGPCVTLTDKVAPIISSVTSTNPTDCGQADGTIVITATSPNGSPIQYSIDGGVTWDGSGSFTGLDASGNTYDIRVRNADGTCVIIDNPILLQDKIQPVITAVASNDPTDCSVNNGTISIAATFSASETPEFSIDGGLNWQLSNNFTGLASGTYNVAIRYTDNSCFTLYPSNPVILNAPDAPSITNVASTDPTDCNVTDGTITIVAIGGTGSYHYSIDGGTSYQASNVFNGLNASSNPYQITVRNSDGTCIVTGSIVNLTDKVAPTISNVASTNPTDCGVADGTITITATSSAGNALEYSIDGGVTYQSSNVFSGLDASGNTYQIRVRNVGGTCIVSGTPVILTDKVQPLITGLSSNDPSNCGVADGSISIAASFSGSVEFSIDGGFTWQASNNFTGLSAGTYFVFIRNTDESCNTPYASNPVILTAPNAPSITNVVTTNPTDCGVVDGTITVSATSGSGSYQYSNDSGTTWQASNVFTNLAGGTYCIFVRNADGTCSVVGPCVTLTDKVAPVIASVTSSNPTDCGVADGTITITATSPNGSPIQYSIDGGATWDGSGIFTGLNASGNTYDIRVRNVDGTCVVIDNPILLQDKIQPVITNVVSSDPTDCSVNNGAISIAATFSASETPEFSIDGGLNWQLSNNFTGLASGTYNVAIRYTDNSCFTLDTNNPVILNAPDAPSITNVASTDPTDCGANDGTITIVAIGGTGSYQYSIDGGTSYQASNVFNGLNASGNPYQITIRNSDGTCIVTGSIVNLTDKVAPTISNVASTNPTDCGVADGTITITATSSAGNAIEYSINGGATYQSSNVFNGLDASNNTYEIRVRNVGGTCIVSGSDINLIDKVQPVINTVTATNPSNCSSNDGSIVIAATGASLEYSIDGGTNWQPSGSFTGLGAGTYNIFTRNTDASCLTAYVSNPVVLTIPDAANITNVASTDPTDCGLTDGTITISAQGGTGSLEYSIDSGTTYQASPNFIGLAGGTYYTFVRNDNNTCIVTGPIEVLTDKVGGVITSVASTDPTDCGQADGTITINAVSPSGNTLQFSIDGGASWQQSGSFTGLDASGNPYQIRIRNIDGTCTVSDADVNLTDKVQPVINSVTATDPSNCGQNDGSIVINATGASLEYSIDGGVNWQISGNFTGLGAGTYNIITRNIDGSCTTPYLNNPVVLSIPNAPTITNVSSTNPTDCGVADGTITITAQGGTSPLEYSIDGGSNWIANGGVFTTLDASTNSHQIMVRNAGGSCEVTGPIIDLTNKVAPAITNVTSTNPTECGVSDGTITITANSSIGNALEYSIDGGATWQSANIFIGLDASNNPYAIRVRNADATCMQSSPSINLIDKVQPVISTIASTDPTECGTSNGTITVTASGASIEYSIDGGTNWQPTGNFTSLGAGTYNIFVRNTDLSCNTPYASNPVILTAPNAPSITNVVETQPTNCGVNDGTITVTAVGGSGSYSYSIDSGSTFQPSNSFTSLGGGTYFIFVQNAKRNLYSSWSFSNVE